MIKMKNIFKILFFFILAAEAAAAQSLTRSSYCSLWRSYKWWKRSEVLPLLDSTCLFSTDDRFLLLTRSFKSEPRVERRHFFSPSQETEYSQFA